MENTPYMDILRKAFPDREFYQRVVAHITHDCLKNGSSIKCGEFLSENWLSYLLTDIAPSTLDCDSYYFKRLSEDDLKTAFFKTLILDVCGKDHLAIMATNICIYQPFEKSGYSMFNLTITDATTSIPSPTRVSKRKALPSSSKIVLDGKAFCVLGLFSGGNKNHNLML